ncbi:hypothetical protein M409DRAFT_54094 [Zasmidium cellare ATCC 36951]|uniref:Uncharacterized protein n=1 Tax=Zasmidium cellare ATCC 36951 TaxID=1080233 RepID=A0A6A6CK08_ZASCE|nr:uncharacterized protein M409DRAFT_54094 [Zasmidium cellare ATCC 36951]KAF2167495.1 hypothetical protein M409DRAFT_54094 [Zasmidium cellare ATCC 36951]
MADMILPMVALAGLVHAAPQGGLNLGGAVGAGAGLGAGLGLPVGGAAVPTSRIPSITLPTLPITTSATQVAVPVPVVGGGSAGVPALPSVALPSVAAGGLPNPAGLVPSVGGGLPALPTSGLPAVGGGLPALPPSALPALPTNGLPSLPVSGLSAAGLPHLPVEAPSLTLPALLQTSFPTGSILPVDIKTLVPLANTDIISTLSGLPANAAATGAIQSALAAIPTSGLPTLPEVPTGILPGGLPELTAAPEVNSILESVTSDALAKVISAVASALAQVASVAGGALPTPAAALPSSVLSALQNLPTAQITGAVAGVTGVAAGVVPTGLPATPSILPAVGSVPNVTLPGRMMEEDSEESDKDEEAKEKRQLPGGLGDLLGGGSPLAGVQGAVGSLTSGAGLGAVVGGLTANNQLVGNVANVVNGIAGGATPLSFLNPLLGSTGGLAGLSAVLAGTPLGGILTSPAGIPSIVLSTTKNIPLLAPLSSLTGGVKSAATLPLTDLLSSLPLLSSLVRNAISTLNTFGLYNVDPFTQLVPLTNIAALQTAVQFINPKDLALATYILGGSDVLSSNALGSLLQDPTQLVKAVSAAAPVADNLPAVASFLVLGNLGATGLQNLVPGVDTSVVQNLLAKLPVGSLPTLPTGALTGGLPVKERLRYLKYLGWLQCHAHQPIRRLAPLLGMTGISKIKMSVRRWPLGSDETLNVLASAANEGRKLSQTTRHHEAAVAMENPVRSHQDEIVLLQQEMQEAPEAQDEESSGVPPPGRSY